MRQQNGTAAPPSVDGVTRALEEYLAAAEAGTAPPREQFLARYPELAEDLDACLAALHFIGRAAEGPRSVVAEVAGAMSAEQPLGQLGDFRLIREVGRGGMGVVYEAEQVSLGRRVALKVLPFAATMDPRQLQRFQNEARAAASLDHPHIVHVHAVGCERAVHFYAMQMIDGQTLAAMIADLRQAGGRPVAPDAQPTTAHVPEAPAPAAETATRAAASTERAPRDRAYFRRVAELGIQAAEALDYAHELGVVHRDVKPANLLLDARGNLWVTDFGLAHIQSNARLTMTGDLVGTLRYMSPEQALAKRVVVDHRTDVYSLGATLYELLTLEPVYGDGDRQELLRQIAFEEPKPPRRINQAIPAELQTIVLKAMEKNSADRYTTGGDVAADLRRFLADEPIQARPAGVARRLWKWGRRHPAAVAAALTAAVIVLTGGIGWVANDRAKASQATARLVLGKSLAVKGDLDGAIDEYREAIRLNKDDAFAQGNLGLALAQKGQFADALPHLRLGHELGAKDPRFPTGSDELVKDCERLIELDGKLPAILSGMEQPANATERAEYADVCRLKRLYVSAARLYEEAFAANPKLELQPGLNRWHAACVAALAASGAGEDADTLSDTKRARLRKQAHDWLRGDLDYNIDHMGKRPAEARDGIAKATQEYLREPAFNGVRGAEALGKLPEAERKDWQKLWADTADLLAKAQGKTAAEQRPAVK